MKKLQEQVKEKLLKESNKIYRNRSKKNEFIAQWMHQEYPTLLGQISLSTLTDIVLEIVSVDRNWRLALSNNPELRGSDYGEKKKREKEAIQRLYPDR